MKELFGLFVFCNVTSFFLAEMVMSEIHSADFFSGPEDGSVVISDCTIKGQLWMARSFTVLLTMLRRIGAVHIVS